MAKRFKAGDIFALELPTGEFMTGRVLLDVKNQCIRPKLLSSDSRLGFFNGYVLTEVYRQTFSKPTAERSEVLIPGVWTDSGSLKDGDWQIIGYEDIDPTKVEFPEAFIIRGSRTILFLRGEIKIPIEMTYEEYEQLRVRNTKGASGLLGEICLYYLGRKDEINDPDLVDVELRSLKHSDLRFNEFRSEAYRRLGEDENISYFEMSQKYGFDIRRFYEIDKDKKKQLAVDPSPLEFDDDEILIVCPYCKSIVDDKDEICATCNEDMTKDAKWEMTGEQRRTWERISCKSCGKSILDLTYLCPHCRQWQIPRENALATS
jgi:RNA polymerase subunit RPABC4/transcription elongation factor Spt4